MIDYLQLEPDKIEIGGSIYYCSKLDKNDRQYISGSDGGHAVNVYVRSKDAVRDLTEKFKVRRSYRFHWRGEHKPFDGVFIQIHHHHRQDHQDFFKITLVYREVIKAK